MAFIRTPNKNDFIDFNNSPITKRPLEKTTNEDIYNLLVDMKTTFKKEIDDLKNEIRETKNDLKQQMNGVKTDIDKVKTNMNVINEKLNAVEEKVNSTSVLTNQNSITINSMLQSRLENCMEISGCDPIVIESSTDLKSLAINIISSFGIPLKKEEISRVSRRTYAVNKGNDQISHNILMVNFNDFNKKLDVMKKKSAIKESRGIYFNIALTATNRFLMMKAKQIARTKTLKTFFSGGKIRVEKMDKTELIINDEQDLTKLQLYVNQIPLDMLPNSSKNIMCE